MAQELTHPPAIKEHTEANSAPLQPLLALGRGNPKVESTIGKALKERFSYHYKLEKRIREGMIAVGYQTSMFIEGKQVLRANPWAPGQWIPYTPTSPNAREKRAMNFTRFYATNCLWKWQLSNPDIVVVAGIDTEEAQESAQAADIITEHYERKFFGNKPLLTIQEGLQGLCWGSYIWGVRYDDTQHSVTAIQPIFGMKPVTLGNGWGQCGDCGYAGPALDGGQPVFQQQVVDPMLPPQHTCPQCGGEALVEQPPTELMPSVVGQQAVPLGDLTCELKAFPECIWDYRHTVEESSWFIHMRQTSAQAIRRLLGNIRLPQGEGMEDFGLQIMSKLAWASGGGSGQSQQDERKRNLYEDPVSVVEYSLGPDDYADIILKQPEETVSGGVIPAGPLINTFPNGLTAQGINGFAVLTGLFNEHHSTSHKSGVWHAKPSSGAGQGLDDLIEVQKRFNATDSQILTFLRASSTPAMRAIKEAISEESRGQYLGDPSMNVMINAANIPEGMRPDQIVGPVFQPQSVPAQFFGYTYQHLNNFAQLTSMNTDFSGGLPGVNNKTATGAQISQANSHALFTPPLQVKGEVRLSIAKIVIELYRTHFPVDRPFPLKGNFGRQQYKYLSGANIGNDIQFEVAKDSELPRNMFTKREDYSTFFAMLGGVAGYDAMQKANPELTAEIERAFNVRLKSATYDQVGSLCQQRLSQLKQFSQFVPDPTLLTGLVQDPMSGMVMKVGEGTIDPPIALQEPDHNVAAKWLSEWLSMDDGQQAAPVLRGSVILLVGYHFQLYGQQQSAMALMQGAVATAGAAPGMSVAPPTPPSDEPDTSVPNPNKPTAITGRPKPKSKQ